MVSCGHAEIQQQQCIWKETPVFLLIMATSECGEAERHFGNSDSKQSETWKRHIIRQLKYRDKAQKILFQDVIRSYLGLLERCTQKAFITKGILSVTRPLLLSSSEDSLSSLKTATGELAYQVVELQQEIKIKETFLEKQHARLYESQNDLSAVQLEYGKLQASVAEVEERNRLLKSKYDALLERHQHTERAYRKEELSGSELLEDMIHWKQQAAERMNDRNERRVRAREAGLNKDPEATANKKFNFDKVPQSASSPSSPSLLRSESGKRAERSHGRLFRSASATSPRFLGSIKDLFERKRRGSSICSLEEHLSTPSGICLAARVPNKAIHLLDAHELGINAVRFSPRSNLLATGGTDRVIKLWDIVAGMLHYRGTLDGSNEGITSIEFDSTGTRILAASYDKSALFWRLDDFVPKFTLTGHSRKVTAARFMCNLRQVVTGSADRTVKIWDLQRAACIQTIEVLSYCSDVVCSEYYVISGHYDRKIRFWDSRAASCTQEVPLQGRVTSLDISPNHRELLSCSRDESLQLVDLRRSNTRMAFRADGFKCGSDSTKAIFSPDGSYLVAGSADGTVYIWNVGTGNLETQLPDMHSSSVNAVAWSMSGEYVVSVDKSRRAILWSDI
ncbi:autophagy-related protein 16-2 [Electrophorus electricus]|uniref:autophagy-related protein 16-2 n=1 Tax=Electrophorus electricus TaxID=8005 RepID=UPI0015D01F3E|nr:autophagy-related protein 16-2 [Electrophorus electricus]